MTHPKTIESSEVRTRILDLLQAGPKRTVDLTNAIYPGAPTQTPEKAPSKWSSQVSTQVRMLEQQGKVEKDGNTRFSPWTLRTKPQVDDLPANPQKVEKRGKYVRKAHPNGHANGAVSDGFKAYLIREIRMKLDELERLA